MKDRLNKNLESAGKRQKQPPKDNSQKYKSTGKAQEQPPDVFYEKSCNIS